MSMNFDRLNVLIIDDNAHMRRLVRDIMRGLGIGKVIEVADGTDALNEMRMSAVDVAFCDWMMEPLDGLDFVRLVRMSADSPNPFLPIIMLTGHTERHRIIEARDAGVNEFLAKPVTPDGVYKRLQAIIERPRPFVKIDTYIGPDRRRRTEDAIGAMRRKDDASPKEVSRELPGESLGESFGDKDAHTPSSDTD